MLLLFNMLGLNGLAKWNDTVKAAKAGGVVDVNVGIGKVGKLLVSCAKGERLLADVGAATQ